MGRRIHFSPSFDQLRSVITRQEAEDLIDILYRWDDGASFVLMERALGDAKKLTCGQESYDSYSNTHTISLCLRHIVMCSSGNYRIGGNQRVSSPRMATGLVLAHEIQHANQEHMDNFKQAFWAPTRKYARRPAEKDARNFADANVEVVAAVLGVIPPYRSSAPLAEAKESHDPNLLAIADDLEGCQEVARQDLVDELRASHSLNPQNVQRLSSLLEKKGVRIV